MKETAQGTFVLSTSWRDARWLHEQLTTASVCPDFALGIDVETKTTKADAKTPNPRLDDLVGVGIGIYDSHASEGLACYFLANDNCLNTLRYDLPGLGWYAHNAMFDATVLRRYGIRLGTHLGDPRIIAYLLGEPDAGLKGLLQRWLNYETTDYLEILDQWGAADISQVPVEAQADYCGLQDALQVVRLAQTMEPEMTPRAADVYHKVELPMVPILVEMSHTGIRFDRAAAEPMYIQEAQTRDGLDDIIAQMVRDTGFVEQEKRNGEVWQPVCRGCRNGSRKRLACTECDGRGKLDPVEAVFNPGSPDQLRRWLYGHMHAPVRRWAGGRKQWQVEADANRGIDIGEGTDSLALLQLRGFHPVVPLILSRRKAAKRAGFLKQWLTDSEADGRLHTSFRNTTVVSGRLSSAKPNLQQVTFDLRHLFTADP